MSVIAGKKRSSRHRLRNKSKSRSRSRERDNASSYGYHESSNEYRNRSRSRSREKDDAKKFLEYKSEWEIELLFKTPDLRSHKFWKIKKVSDVDTVVNFGRYGKKCRVSYKKHPSFSEANTFIRKMIRQKLNKGYFKVKMIGSKLALC